MAQPNLICPFCGKEMIPAPARFDGERTYVGYCPCNCHVSYMARNRQWTENEWQMARKEIVLEPVICPLSETPECWCKPEYGPIDWSVFR